MTGDPSTRDQSKHCAYHKAKGHQTKECKILQIQIKYRIRHGYLKAYIANRGQHMERPLQEERPRPMQVANTQSQQEANIVIHTIHGGPRMELATQSALKSHYQKLVQVCRIYHISQAVEIASESQPDTH